MKPFLIFVAWLIASLFTFISGALCFIFRNENIILRGILVCLWFFWNTFSGYCFYKWGLRLSKSSER
jgi:hypothetical protein